MGGSAPGTVNPVRFGASGDQLMQIDLPGRPLTVGLPGAALRNPTVTNTSEGGLVRYSDALPGTDLTYQVSGNKVKESIVIKNPNAPYSYTFRLADPTHRLGRPVQTAEGGWQFSTPVGDEHTTLGFAPPAVWEQNAGPDGDRSASTSAAHLTVTRTPAGYDVTVSVDRSWLAGKTFPIVLDPTTVWSYASQTISVAEASVSPTGCGGGPCPLVTATGGSFHPGVVGFNPSAGEFRGYLHFDLSNLLGAGRVVTSANLSFYEADETCSRSRPAVDLHAVNGLLTGSNTGVDLAATEDRHVLAHRPGGDPTCPVTANFDIAGQVNRWLDTGQAANAGVALQLSDPAGAASDFFSDPVLSITYVGPPAPPPIPVEQTFGCACDYGHGADVTALVADPVNTANGGSMETVVDATVPAPGVPLRVDRTYNGADGTAGPLGSGWTSALFASVSADPVTGNVTARDATGGRVTFLAQPGGGYLPPAGVTATLQAATGGGWTLISRARETRTFDSAGRLVSDVDEAGHGVTLAYSSGRLDTITDSLGQVATLRYGTAGAATGRLVGVNLPDGRSVGYGYATVAGAARLSSVVGVDGKTTTVSYDTNLGLLNGITDPDNRTSAQNTFASGTGRVAGQQDAAGATTTFAWDPATSTATTTDARGGVSTDVYSGNVRVAHTDPLGRTTRYAYDSNLNLVLVVDPAGNVTQLTYDAAGNLLTRMAPAPLNYTESWTYDAENHVTSHTDGNNHTTTWTYTPAGQVASVTAPDGAVTSYTYTALGQVATITDPRQQVTTNTWDSHGDLTRVVDPAGGVTTMTYDSAHRLLSRTTPRGNVAGCACAAAYTTTWTYDAAGRPLTATNPAGHVTTNTYTPAGDLASVQNPAGKTTTFSYDANHRLLTGTDALNHVTTNTYTAAGDLATVTDATGAKSTYGYDVAGQLTSTTRPNGNVAGASQATTAAYTTTHGYDLLGNQVSASVPNPAQPGQTLTTFTDYDPLGRPTSVTNPAGETTSTAYDGAGNVIAVTDGRFRTTTRSFDAANRPTAATTPAGLTTQYGYDPAGNLTTSTSPLGAVSSYGYDALDRRTSAVDPRGHVTGANPADYTWTYGYDPDSNPRTATDPLGHTTTTAYDNAGRISGRTDPNNHTTTCAYDALDRLTGVTAPDANPPGNPGTTSYGYDDAGRLTSRTDANNHTTTYAYDPAGRRTQLVSPLGQTWTYGYDPNGNRTEAVTAIGTATPAAGDGTLAVGYDSLDRPTTVDYSEATPDVGYSYDKAGRRASMTDGAGTETYGYDAAGELTAVTRGSATWTYGYTPDGQVGTRTMPDGTTVFALYDGDGALSEISSLRNGVAGPGANYTRDAAGNLLTTTLPAGNGYVESRSYDRAGRLTEVANTRGTATMSRFAQTLDPVGNPMTVATTRGTTTTYEAYAYDAADRLTQDCLNTSTCAGATRTNTYTYDPVGNRTSLAKVGGANPDTFTYTYNAADQLTQTVNGAGPTTYRYDADGNQTKAGARTFSYDLAHRLVSTTLPGTTTSYSYDGAGNRLTAATNGAVTDRFTWDLNNPLPQLAREDDGTGNLLRRYITDGTRAIGMTTPSGDFYYHYDPLGSVTDLTGASGAKQWKYAYDAYGGSTVGTQQIATNAPANPLTFTGQYQDGDTGQYYLRARQYDPKTGRFTATDPQDIPVGQPYVAAYAYAFNRPTLLVDPSGQWPHWLDVVLDVKAAADEAALHVVTHPWELVTGPAAVAGQAYYGAGGGLQGAALAIETINPVAGIRDTFEQAFHDCSAGNDLSCGAGLLSGTVQSALLVCPVFAGARLALIGRGAAVRGIAAEGRFTLIERARMGRSLNPEAGAIGGGAFTGRATAHGAERIAEAGFDDIDVALIRAGNKYEQSDGAFAYVAQAGKNGYNMIIQNSDGAVVTAHRGMSFSDLSRLARNYGWSGW